MPGKLRKIPVECYTRVCGYFRPTRNANKGKAEEIRQRKLQDPKKIDYGEKKKLTENLKNNSLA